MTEKKAGTENEGDRKPQQARNPDNEAVHAQWQAWQQIMDLSERLLPLAEASDWQALDALSAERETLLQAFFQQPIAPALHEEIQRDIAQIRAQDEKTVQLVQKNRSELADEIQRLQARKKMVQDYLDHSE